MTEHRGNRPVLVGASGRVGQRIGASWRTVGQNFIPVSRSPGGAAMWDMTGPPPPLVQARDQAVIVLSGVVPAPAAALSGNAFMARAGIAAARTWGAAHCFVLSSSAVYGPTGAAGADEDAPLGGTSPYARAKIEMERTVAGPGVTVLRLANVAGVSEPFLSLDVGTSPVLDRFADGDGPSRSFIGPATLAAVLAALADRARRGATLPSVLNVAEPRPVPMAALFQAAGRGIVWRDAPAGAIQHVHLAVARLGAVLETLGAVGDPHASRRAADSASDAARLWAEARATEAAA